MDVGLSLAGSGPSSPGPRTTPARTQASDGRRRTQAVGRDEVNRSLKRGCDPKRRTEAEEVGERSALLLQAGDHGCHECGLASGWPRRLHRRPAIPLPMIRSFSARFWSEAAERSEAAAFGEAQKRGCTRLVGEALGAKKSGGKPRAARRWRADDASPAPVRERNPRNFVDRRRRREESLISQPKKREAGLLTSSPTRSVGTGRPPGVIGRSVIRPASSVPGNIPAASFRGCLSPQPATHTEVGCAPRSCLRSSRRVWTLWLAV